jgi:quinol monooxygenase YgiN
MAAGVVHIPWYATFFRGDALEAALAEIAPVSLRYGATDYRVYRSRDDMYKFLQMATFEDKTAFEAYWYGPEFTLFRAQYSGYYQVPVLYVFNDLVIEGGIDREPASILGAPVNGDST